MERGLVKTVYYQAQPFGNFLYRTYSVYFVKLLLVLIKVGQWGCLVVVLLVAVTDKLLILIIRTTAGFSAL